MIRAQALLLLAMMTPVLPAVAEEDAPMTTYSFEDELVPGDLVRPGGEVLQVRRKGPRRTLIQVREHFVSELTQTVEDL